jgi:hypothetical protein
LGLADRGKTLWLVAEVDGITPPGVTRGSFVPVGEGDPLDGLGWADEVLDESSFFFQKLT